MTPSISYIYLLTSSNPKLMPIKWDEKDLTTVTEAWMGSLYGAPKTKARFLRSIKAFTSSDVLTRQFRLMSTIPSLPPGAVERLNFDLGLTENQEDSTLLVIRIHSSNNYHDFPFKIKLVKE